MAQRKYSVGSRFITICTLKYRCSVCLLILKQDFTHKFSKAALVQLHIYSDEPISEVLIPQGIQETPQVPRKEVWLPVSPLPSLVGSLTTIMHHITKHPSNKIYNMEYSTDFRLQCFVQIRYLNPIKFIQPCLLSRKGWRRYTP
jgi:hypothetical protein